MLTGNEIRSKFIEFFKDKTHKHFESASLIPDDPTLLLTVAGMVPFKPFFLGQKEAPYPRVTTYQKCIRTNDLENVGRTARHHTFFEMLGNFSFGDYFKREAIEWSWEFVTEILKFDKEKLWVSVFKDDDETAKIWQEIVGIPAEKIVRLGEEDNFWAAGPTGSCGPCSEIYIDMGEEFGCESPTCGVGCDCDRYLEIWNLVFTEYNRLEDGSLEPLPKKNIDTGAGLERLTAALNKTHTTFETDLLFPILEKVAEMANVKYKNNEKTDFSLKVITDHIRAIIFLISDGVLPSNEGRGYVLRRILRRAVRHGRLLNITDNFLYKLVDFVVDMMKNAYPELEKTKEHVRKVIKIEEEKFSKTLDQGIEMAIREIEKLKLQKKTKFDAETVFKLYDTYGFPFELTEEIAIEHGIKVSFDEFNEKMEEQKNRARNSREVIKEEGQDEFIEKFYDIYGKTNFEGYNLLETKAIVYDIQKLEENKLQIIFDKTVFYAESGGQVSDSGIIIGDNFNGKVIDVQKRKDIYLHIVEINEGDIEKGNELILKVDKEKRDSIKRNHTATHLLHEALKEVVGEHVNQAGSLVTEDRLRFDFTHYEGLTRKQVEEVERIVNKKIFENLEVKIEYMDIESAKSKGAMALFGDKYGDIVRVVSVEGFSIELCGGTHVNRTGEIGLFNILHESGIAAGVRRIEATTGYKSFEVVNEMEREILKVAELLKTDINHIEDKIIKLLETQKELTKELEITKSKLATYEANSLFNEIEEINGVKVLLKTFKNKEAGELREIVDKAKEKLNSCVVVLGTNNKKAIFAVGVTKDLINKIKAGDLVRKIAEVAGGKGGGRADFAQAGGPNGDKVTEAIKLAKKILTESL
ncbi:alanyl-tRNA synthetase [Hypnocyclicus thermotrophus]|uniref:Alanine--tRNA ligase n=1 Tax=Hypnocyclicus thermotrophus TaxID=1627895 RepID=A0AA46DY68_9FUSO|nr:alanine--tRNA ligase [Hypnocyclicus thermotrophus]TDT69217.1 alanyl-tRNA synthetase [Hypnocyclicus thermotrophus]